MKQPIRSFSIGLLTSSIILLIVLVFFDQPNTKSNELSVDEMISAIETDGYHVLSEPEYIALSVNVADSKDSDKKQDEPSESMDKEKKSDDTSEEQEKITYTLKVKADMMPPSVIDLLVENNIIDDATKFNQYLEEHELSTLIQIGEHQLTNEMSISEVAEEITK